MSKPLENKIDFVVLVTAEMANANGDPLNGNRPRADYSGYGEISDVCIKRKIRNRMQDLGYDIFVQSQDRCEDGFDSLKSRADKVLKEYKKTPDQYHDKACETWLDVRTFGQVFAFGKEQEDSSGISVGVRGPVSIHQGKSVSPIDIHSQQITKSVNGEPTKSGKRSSDTMGLKHMVRFGLYKIKGSINVQLAEKTGFSQDDADILKECLKTLFENDASAARPEGSMEVVRLYWWQHQSATGQYATAKVHRSIKITQKDAAKIPDCIEDYEITAEELPGLSPEIYDNV